MIRQAFVSAFPALATRYPIAVVCIDMLPGDLDVNLEPNKTTVLLHNLVGNTCFQHAPLDTYRRTGFNCKCKYFFNLAKVKTQY